MNQPIQPILILGTRIFAEEVADLVSEIPGFQVAGFVENMEPERCQKKMEGLPIYWVEDLPKLAEDHLAICGLTTTHRSRYTEQVAALGIRFASLVHPSARVSPKSTLGEGSMVSVGSIIAAHTHLGPHVIVNRGVLIGHHTEIASHVSVQPGANIAGACRIGEGTYIGMGSVVIDRITIGAHSVVGAGAVVTKDVPDNVQVVGVPARIVKENINGK